MGRFPEVASDLHYVEGGIEAIEASPSVLLTAIHACGPLSDDVLHAALGGGAAVALLPCCHSLRKQRLTAEFGPAYEALAARAAERGMSAALDDARLAKMVAHGYETQELYIPCEITPYNRLLLGAPSLETSAAPMSVDNVPVKRPTVTSASKGQAIKISSIPLADVRAVASIAGRRPKEWARFIEVSLWQPDGAPPTEQALAQLAKLASSAKWRPKIGEEIAGVYYWSTEDAVAAARAAEHEYADGKSEADYSDADGGMSEGCGPPRVEVVCREEYSTPGGSRACSYRITFSRRGMAHTSQVTKGDIGLWQARVREALAQWALEDGRFELR